MSTVAEQLAVWATELDPTPSELELARRSLLDTVAVALAGSREPMRELTGGLHEAGRWAALAHVLDFDDLHLPSTSHVSAVCVPAALTAGGAERAFLAGAGVMARLGSALGWAHYRAGWHTTCTAGAPAAAVAAATGMGLDRERIAMAMALALPAAGGVRRPFGTDGKALQVGFAAEAGVRAARLAAAGAGSDPSSVDDWVALVRGDAGRLQVHGAAVPGGLAIKLFPCCYALQRPIAAVLSAGPVPAEQVRAVRVSTPQSSLAPLIHNRPTTGLEAKFSLQYGIAAALLDGWPALESFTDAAVSRAEVKRLYELIEVKPVPGGEGLLDGKLEIEIELKSGRTKAAAITSPPGAPDRPPAEQELGRKLRLCVGPAATEVAGLSWDTAAGYLRARL